MAKTFTAPYTPANQSEAPAAPPAAPPAPIAAPPTPSAELEALKAQLAAEQAKGADMKRLVEDNAALRAKLAEAQAAVMPELSSEPKAGTYEVTLRHSPAKVKRLKVTATCEADAWEQFYKANLKALDNTKDVDRRELKAFENFCRKDGQCDRQIKLVGAA